MFRKNTVLYSPIQGNG